MLTPHAEEYLEAIYHLGGQDKPVRLSPLAEHLDLTAAAVNEMVRRLAEQGLVSYTPYRGVKLEEEGLCQALAVVRRHRLWERFLTDMLGLSWDVVHDEACKLEHAASEAITERLADLLDQPKSCPHGKPMPPPGCVVVSPGEVISLAAFEPGQGGTVAYVGREEPELLRYLEQLHLLPGAEVTVEQIAPFDGPLTIRVGKEVSVIGRGAAETIFMSES